MMKMIIMIKIVIQAKIRVKIKDKIVKVVVVKIINHQKHKTLLQTKIIIIKLKMTQVVILLQKIYTLKIQEQIY